MSVSPFFKKFVQFNRSFVWPRFDAIHNLNEPNFCLKLQRSNGEMGESRATGTYFCENRPKS